MVVTYQYLFFKHGYLLHIIIKNQRKLRHEYCFTRLLREDLIY